MNEWNKTNECGSGTWNDMYLIKYHGIFQYTAFFLLVPLAIASAHYLRDFAPSLTPWGLRMWFHLHRTLNILAVILTIVGIILTFVVHKWRWIGPAENCKEKPTASMCHALFGIVAVSLLWLQPIGAVFRCAPSHYARKWFYYAHKTMGIMTWILSAVTILIATAKFKSFFSNQPTAFILSILAALLCIIFFLIGEFFHYNSNASLWNNMSTSKTQSVKYSHSLTHRQSSKREDSEVKKQRFLLEFFRTRYHPFFFIAFAIALFVIWVVFITMVGADKDDNSSYI
uniref:ascorbate ferrireductase (transmembrane) n=1 Tax=Acrobeloides nanus TaxID=290746 RepID=A0A914BY83_9BILA